VLVLCTGVTLIAFAANSLLCRMALGGNLIDPVAFTLIRLVGGAAILVPLARFTAEPTPAGASHGSWVSALGLFAYAIAFSLAYMSLTTGMGALILFGAVQATMIGVGLWSGERPHPLQWLGMGAAFAGLVWLVWPGITAPDPLGAVLMGVSGMAWGVYSLRGRGALAPVAASAGNFARSVPMAVFAGVLAGVLGIGSLRAQTSGVLLALISGTVTSGLGYVLWYKALRGLTSTHAAVLQLLVPVIAAMAGVAFLAEAVSLRLLIASVLILGGVGLAVLSPARSKTEG
jgi:drug/metabolite transporter (DMT)-like permease